MQEKCCGSLFYASTSAGFWSAQTATSWRKLRHENERLQCRVSNHPRATIEFVQRILGGGAHDKSLGGSKDCVPSLPGTMILWFCVMFSPKMATIKIWQYKPHYIVLLYPYRIESLWLLVKSDFSPYGFIQPSHRPPASENKVMLFGHRDREVQASHEGVFYTSHWKLPMFNGKIWENHHLLMGNSPFN